MHVYRFYDSDISGQEEYDISGEQYLFFLQKCFEYSTSASVIISPENANNIQSWEQYRIPVTPDVQAVYCHYGSVSSVNPNKIGSYEIRHYRLDLGLKKKILSQTDSLFKWICGWGYNNPNDIAFFRADGSVLFSSIIHEGECTLFLHDTEDFHGIVTQAPWIQLDYDENIVYSDMS